MSRTSRPRIYTDVKGEQPQKTGKTIAMSLLDSFKSAANEGMNLAGVDASHKFIVAAQTQTAPEPTSISALTKQVSTAVVRTESLTNSVTDFFPGRTEAQNLISVGHGTLKNTQTGELFKVRDSVSIASSIPGLSSMLSSIKTDSSQPATDATQKKDEIFSYVSAEEWKNIIKAKADSSASLPKATVDANGVEFVRTAQEISTAGQVKIEGDKNIHVDQDGTTTTQNKGLTEINHLGHQLIKDTTKGLVSDVIAGRVAYQQNTQAHTQEWNTAQGVRVVEENGQYKIYNKDGVLVATRSIEVIANEIEQQTLANGDQMIRHLGGMMSDHIKNRGGKALSESGVEWNVYHDGVSRTLSNGLTVGLLASQDAFVEAGHTIVFRRAQDKKYFVIEGNNTQEIDVKDKSKLAGNLQTAVRMLQWIDQDGKVHLGDGTFLTIKGGKVVGGTDEIVDEPVAAANTDADAAAHNSAILPTVQKHVEVAIVSTGKDATTSALAGGLQSTYNWNTKKDTIVDKPIVDEPVVDKSTGTKFVDMTVVAPTAKPVVEIDNNAVVTQDVITTQKGTTDRVTKDVIGKDGSIDLSNGTHVSANNDIQFADGIKFGHDGSVIAADGHVIKSGSNTVSDAVVQQAASALAAAMSAASNIAGKAASGTVTFADIAELQASIFNVNSLVGVCMNAGNIELAQSLIKTGAGLEGALGAAQHSFTSNTALRAARSNMYQMTGRPADNNYSSLQYRIAA